MDERLQGIIAALCGDDITDETRDASLSEITDDDLGSLEADLVAHFRAMRAGEVEDVHPDDLSALRPVADAVGYLQGEAARRYAVAEEAAVEAAARAEEASKLEAALLAPAPEAPEVAEADTDETPEVETAEEPVEAAAPETAEPVVAEEPVDAVAAAAEPTPKRPSLAELAAARPAAMAPQPAPAQTRPRWESLDGAALTEAEITDRIRAASEEMVGTAPGMAWKRPVVRMKVQFPEDRFLNPVDGMNTNTAKVDALVAGAEDPGRWPDAIAASGGWCAPLEPRYDVFTVAGAHRPFRAGLPTVGAARGGITLARGISIGDITTGGPNTAGAAVGVWDADTDETPGELTKTHQNIDCPTTVDCELQAIYRHYEVGNFLSRAWPERQRAFADVVMSAFAREAETELLDCVCNAAQTVTEAAVLGSARDLLEAFVRARRAIISAQRMSPDTRFRLWIPEWVPGMMVADVVRQQASGETQALGTTEADTLGWISRQGFNVGLYSDGMTGGSGVWNPIGDNTNLINWPTTVQWIIYPEGSFVFLDGGTLDLGVYRDGTLVGTNDFRVFAESFETCCFVGIPEATACVTHTVCPNGESQVATDETGSVCTAS